MTKIPQEFYSEFLASNRQPTSQPRSSYFQIDPTDIKQSITTYKDVEYQIIPTEIEKQAEIGLVLGQIDDEQWAFIDEILPNGMIDTHGVLKEGDYLLQVGSYSLVGIDVTVALILIERAYHEGRNTLSFIAARRLNSSVNKQLPKPILKKPDDSNRKPRSQSQVSFVEYEQREETDNDDDEQDESNDTRL